MNFLQSDGFRSLLKSLGVHHLLDFYFRSFPKNHKYGGMVYTVDSLEGWLLQKEIFSEGIYDGVFETKDIRTFCDLGCNRGFFSLWMASKIGDHARGLLIEANTHLVGKIDVLLRRNHLAGCKVFHGAVGAGLNGGSVEFLIPPTDVGAGLKAVASGVLSNDKCEIQSVPVVGAGELWIQNFGTETRCDLLKVDIEGAEWRFFREEVAFLTLVDRLVVEVHAKMGDEAELLGMIRNTGFTEITRHVAGDGVYLLFADREN